MGDRHIEFLCIACGGFVRLRRSMVLVGFVYDTSSNTLIYIKKKNTSISLGLGRKWADSKATQ